MGGTVTVRSSPARRRLQYAAGPESRDTTASGSRAERQAGDSGDSASQSAADSQAGRAGSSRSHAKSTAPTSFRKLVVVSRLTAEVRVALRQAQQALPPKSPAFVPLALESPERKEPLGSTRVPVDEIEGAQDGNAPESSIPRYRNSTVIESSSTTAGGNGHRVVTSALSDLLSRESKAQTDSAATDAIVATQEIAATVEEGTTSTNDPVSRPYEGSLPKSPVEAQTARVAVIVSEAHASLQGEFLCCSMWRVSFLLELRLFSAVAKPYFQATSLLSSLSSLHACRCLHCQLLKWRPYLTCWERQLALSLPCPPPLLPCTPHLPPLHQLPLSPR